MAVPTFYQTPFAMKSSPFEYLSQLLTPRVKKTLLILYCIGVVFGFVAIFFLAPSSSVTSDEITKMDGVGKANVVAKSVAAVVFPVYGAYGIAKFVITNYPTWLKSILRWIDKLVKRALEMIADFITWFFEFMWLQMKMVVNCVYFIWECFESFCKWIWNRWIVRLSYFVWNWLVVPAYDGLVSAVVTVAMWGVAIGGMVWTATTEVGSLIKNISLTLYESIKGGLEMLSDLIPT
jgi:hypothetical protein